MKESGVQLEEEEVTTDADKKGNRRRPTGSTRDEPPPVYEIKFAGGGDGSDEGDDSGGLDYDGIEGGDGGDGDETGSTEALHASQSGRWCEEVKTAMIRDAGFDPAAPFKAGTFKGAAVTVVSWGPPTRSFQPPVSADRRQAFEEEIATQLANGTIERRASLYRHPVYIIPKAGQRHADGRQKFRAVMDMSLLNSQTKPMRFHTPTLEQMLAKATFVPGGGKRYFAKCDFKSYFFQFPLKEESRHLFAFEGPSGETFCYRVLPMGFLNSPAISALHLAGVMSGLEDYTCALVDDVLVWGDTQQELKTRFAEVLRRFSAYGLQLSVDKTDGGLERIVFGGYVVGANYCAVAPDKVAAVKQWPEPTTVKQVKRFVGFARWLGQFVPNFEARVEPLESAGSRSKGRIVLTREEVAAFEDIKSALVSADFLVPFDHNLPLEVHTDGSRVAGGAVLTQMRPEGRRTVAYMSHKYRSEQSHYPARELEILSVIRAATRYYYYFLMAPRVTIFSDHASLQFLVGRSVQSSQRLARWATFLSQFKVEFVYIEGRLNVAADALSRRDAPDDDKETRFPRPTRAAVLQIRVQARDTGVDKVGHDVYFPSAWLAALVKEYAADEYYAEALQVLRGERELNSVSGAVRARVKRWRIRADGVVIDSSITDRPRIALPAGTVKDQVIKSLHETLVHPGFRPLMGVIGQHYVFPKMADTLEAFTRNCVACLRAKHMTTAQGFADALDFPQSRWHTVMADYATGLQTADGSGGAILVVLDALTRRVILIPTSESATAADLIRDFADHVCFKVGFPRCIRTDKGSVFTSKRFEQFCRAHDIEQSFALTDQHVGSVERVIKNVRQMVRVVSAEDAMGWRNNLAKIEFALNCVPARFDGLSPFERDIGYRPHMPGMPVDYKANVKPDEAVARSAVSLPALVDAYQAGKEASATQHDKGRVASKIHVGSKVCVKAHLLKGPADMAGHSKHAKTRPVFSKVVVVLEDRGHGNWLVSPPPGAGKRLTLVFHESVLKVAGDKAGDNAGPDKDEEERRFWQDGSRRVAKVLGYRLHYRKEQMLVRFMAETDPVWVDRGSLPHDKALIDAYPRAQPKPTQG